MTSEVSLLSIFSRTLFPPSRSLSTLRLVLSLLESSRTPLPSLPWLLGPRPAGTHQEMRQATLAAPEVRDEGPGPERAPPGAWSRFSCLVVVYLATTARQGCQGPSTGAAEPRIPSAWGPSQHFSVGHILN